jgi:signal transduction histidine kinase
VDVEDGLPVLQADPDQLIQVLSNLLQNAVKFTPTGSVHLSVRREDNALLVAVRDTGIGIPAGQLESIFDKFHQVRHGDTVDDTSKGTGLGLAICRQIVRHYGGHIWAESQPGQGSIFSVRLPLPQQPRQP